MEPTEENKPLDSSALTALPFSTSASTVYFGHMFMFLEQIDGRLRQSSCPLGCLDQKRDLLMFGIVLGSKYEKVHTKIKVEAWKPTRKVESIKDLIIVDALEPLSTNATTFGGRR